MGKGGILWELGWERRRRLMSFASCQGLQMAGPHLPNIVLAGFALARGRHSTCSPPAPGAQVAGKGILKGHLAKRPCGTGGEGASNEVSPTTQLILT